MMVMDRAILLQITPPSRANWHGPRDPHRGDLYNPRDRNPRDEEDLPMGEMKDFAGLYYREGALDPKTTQLVALAAMAAAGCTS
jgi:hypothetical protein